MKLRLRISLKIALLVTSLLVSTFLVVTPILVGSVTRQAKESLINQAKSFASLSTRPIGDAFLLYRDSGLTKLHEQVERVTERDTVIANTLIVDVNGQKLYEHDKTTVTIPAELASRFEPLYEYDSQGFVSRAVYPFIESNGAHRYTMVYAINAAEIKATLNSLESSILFVGLLITALTAAVLVIFIELLFIRPLQRMSRLAASISAGNYDQGVTIHRHDEIGDLGQALNDMARKLQADIEELKSAEQLKSEFLIISSHNFRTPLTVIRGYLDLLKEKPLDDQTKNYLNTIGMYADQLITVTNDMLTVAELEGHAQPHLTMQMTEISAFVRSLLPAIETRVAKRSQTLKTELPPDHLYATIHSTYLQTSLWNLLDNACKFTPEKGIITLRLSQSDGFVRLAVTDTGVGISETEQANLFTKFHRGTSIMKYEYEGMGLGLYMTRLIVELMGGRVEVQSREGEGSTFTIVLPATPVGDAGPAPDMLS